jgi:DNA-binding SARP family transcriptional activator/tetratricopeptide (TPR) repeat protein
VRIRVLGGLAVEGVEERRLGSRKARTLLKVLVLARGAAVPVDRLVDVLWPDDPPARPTEQVGVLVSRLRNALGAERLVRRDGGYAASVDWLDADELALRVAEATAAREDGRTTAARVAATSALALARGPLLPDEDGPWAVAERAACDALVATARLVAAEAALDAGDHLAAVAQAEASLAHDPHDERALRVLMRAHAASGSPASALAAYVRVRDRLVEDFGVSPTAETEALHDAIALAGPDGAPRPPRPASTGTPVAGRHRERAALDRALQQVTADGRPRLVALAGEPGIGKTTVVEEWCRSIGPGALVLLGSCDVLGRDLPLQPLADAVAAHLAASPADQTAVLGEHAADLAPLLLHHPAAPVTVVADPAAGRARLFAALLAVVRHLAGERVAVVVVDDVHHAGESTTAWLRFALRRGSRLLVVTASRDAGPAIDGSPPLVLGPLDRVATAEVVGDERADDLHDRSGGHPLLLAALAGLERDGQPATVEAAVARRLDALRDPHVLRTAAVLGPDVDLDLVADVLRRPAAEVLSHLEEAAAAGVLVARGAGFAFRHELEREALADGVGGARQTLVHRAAALALTGRPQADPLAVALHARRGGERSLAVRWLTLAAEIALARADVDAAAAHLDTALGLEDDPAAFVGRARLRMATARFDDAAADAARAVELGGGVSGLEISGWVAYYRRRYDEALAFADAAIDRATDPSVRASCLALAGRVRHGIGDLGVATGHLQAAVAQPDAPALQPLAAIWLAQARAHQGRPEDALVLLDRALVEPHRVGHPFAPMHGWFTRVMALGQLGRAQDALVACDELDAEVRRRGELGQRFTAPAVNVRAWVLRWTGRPDEADERNQAAVESSDPDGVRAEAYYAGLLDLVVARLLAGDDGAAADLLQRVSPIESWNGTMAWHQRHRWLLLRSRLALRDGDRTTAAALSDGVRVDAAARGALRYELLATAVGRLAGGSADAGARPTGEVVDGLRRCAALDGAWLVEALERPSP